MKRISVLCAVCLMAVADICSAQSATQFLTFNDNNGVGDAGTYNPNDSFSLDIFLTFSGYNSAGLSFWLETTADAAPHIVLTGYTRGTTFLAASGHMFPVGFTLLQSNGLYTTPNPSDLGFSTPNSDSHAVPPGTYFIENLSVSLTGLAPGTYILRSDALSPHASEAASFDGTSFADHALPNATYTITVVPEPSTFALLAVSTVGVVATFFRRVFVKKPAA